MPEPVHFDILAPFYDKLFPFDAIEPLINILDVTCGGYLLDVGGGTGRISIPLMNYFKVILLDVSLKMLKQAREKVEILSVMSKSEMLPFDSDFFDRVIMVDALHHVKSRRTTSKELWRVLKPGGKILIIEPNIERYFVKILALLEKVLLMRSHFLNLQEIVDLYSCKQSSIQTIKDKFNLLVVIEKTT